jgi:hypothetical protein
MDEMKGINSILLKPATSEKNPDTRRFLFLKGRMIRLSTLFLRYINLLSMLEVIYICVSVAMDYLKGLLIILSAIGSNSFE